MLSKEARGPKRPGPKKLSKAEPKGPRPKRPGAQKGGTPRAQKSPKRDLILRSFGEEEDDPQFRFLELPPATPGS